MLSLNDLNVGGTGKLIRELSRKAKWIIQDSSEEAERERYVLASLLMIREVKDMHETENYVVLNASIWNPSNCDTCIIISKTNPFVTEILYCDCKQRYNDRAVKRMLGYDYDLVLDKLSPGDIERLVDENDVVRVRVQGDIVLRFIKVDGAVESIKYQAYLSGINAIRIVIARKVLDRLMQNGITAVATHEHYVELRADVNIDDALKVIRKIVKGLHVFVHGNGSYNSAYIVIKPNESFVKSLISKTVENSGVLSTFVNNELNIGKHRIQWWGTPYVARLHIKLFEHDVEFNAQLTTYIADEITLTHPEHGKVTLQFAQPLGFEIMNVNDGVDAIRNAYAILKTKMREKNLA